MTERTAKILVRSIPLPVFQGLEALSKRHERSVEAEARFAIQSWVEPLLLSNNRSMRAKEVAGRLQLLLEQVNAVTRQAKMTPSYLAEQLHEERAGLMEKWFTGEDEPTFKQLDAIAEYLGANPDWLKHGDKHVFPFEPESMPRGVTEGARWLLDLDKPQSERLTRLHFVRADDETGAFVIVKQYNDWRCKSYGTPFHISEATGATGGADLIRLAIIFELLYKSSSSQRNGASLQSYILPDKLFKKLCESKFHPLTLVYPEFNKPWWEDIWDTRSQNEEYWPGWKSLCQRIAKVTELDGYKAEIELIRTGEHPLFKQP
jgi:antitoxin FitA